MPSQVSYTVDQLVSIIVSIKYTNLSRKTMGFEVLFKELMNTHKMTHFISQRNIVMFIISYMTIFVRFINNDKFT